MPTGMYPNLPHLLPSVLPPSITKSSVQSEQTVATAPAPEHFQLYFMVFTCMLLVDRKRRFIPAPVWPGRPRPNRLPLTAGGCLLINQSHNGT
jgi:hypothetical protein